MRLLVAVISTPRVLVCSLCVCACQGVQLALAMQNECEALCANSYLSHVLDAVSLLGGGDTPNLPFASVMRDMKLG